MQDVDRRRPSSTEQTFYFIAAVLPSKIIACNSCRWAGSQLSFTVWPVGTPTPRQQWLHASSTVVLLTLILRIAKPLFEPVRPQHLNILDACSSLDHTTIYCNKAANNSETLWAGSSFTTTPFSAS
jgi:hypothetical protein